ncbi:hypothetical protein BCR33DRAFT_717011 [Rhizoclosmatium globosum]|uniref:UspA domain-containing protein n=1 Tax=Rhizoclosmatium globosum TaxID=329046 RepID=A0A1Y2CDX3_9FUNG|nr:hypothetical protein BCR33DRAFT_717011 [Rhizoclosmatium globosum]|eukprot:ORY44505.1 hypothetical protein BCR33DRAFT_717011 [Rhizoclosmatium globosum]
MHSQDSGCCLSNSYERLNPPSSVLVLLDETTDTEHALKSAIHNLSKGPNDCITIFRIVSSCSEQQPTLQDTMSLLQRFGSRLNSEASFSICVFLQGEEANICQLVYDTRPELLMIGLGGLNQSLGDALSSFFTTEEKLGVDVKNLQSMEEEEEWSISNEDESMWVLGQSRRCGSPVSDETDSVET